jgi:ribosomal protein S18 acetylase RimI-like enzyme
VSTPPVEIRPTIDRLWLQQAVREEPLLHAYAVWDLEQSPNRVRFASAVRGPTTLGYLLLWPLGDGSTVVHWLGDPEVTRGLVDWLPPRPLIVLCSETAAPQVERARGPAVTRAVLAEVAPVGPPPPAGPLDELVRRLGPDERPLLQAFSARQTERIGSAYTGIDPALEPIWAGFHQGRIVAVARPAARLSHLWVIGGVFVDPERRNLGWGRAVVRAVMVEAARAAAQPGLFVREDSAPARALYDALGFRPVARRMWVDAGTGRDP